MSRHGGWFLVVISALVCAVVACAKNEDASEARSGRESKPAATKSVSVSVFATISSDPVGGGTQYEYSVYNSSSSSEAVELFGLRSVGAVYGADTPFGWIMLKDYQGVPGSIVWAAVGSNEGIPADIAFFDRPADNAVFPGNLMHGFRLRTYQGQSYSGWVAPPFQSIVSMVEEDDVSGDGPFAVGSTIWSSGNDGTVEVPGLPSTADVGPQPRKQAFSVPEPNPSAGDVRLSFALPAPGRVRLTILDPMGRRVIRLRDAWYPAGSAQVTWNGEKEGGGRVAPGVYYTQLVVSGVEIGSHRVVIVR